MLSAEADYGPTRKCSQLSVGSALALSQTGNFLAGEAGPEADGGFRCHRVRRGTACGGAPHHAMSCHRAKAGPPAPLPWRATRPGRRVPHILWPAIVGGNATATCTCRRCAGINIAAARWSGGLSGPASRGGGPHPNRGCPLHPRACGPGSMEHLGCCLQLRRRTIGPQRPTARPPRRCNLIATFSPPRCRPAPAYGQAARPSGQRAIVVRPR